MVVCITKRLIYKNRIVNRLLILSSLIIGANGFFVHAETKLVAKFDTLSIPADTSSHTYLYVGDFDGNGLEDVLVIGRPGPSSVFVDNPDLYPRYYINIILQSSSGVFELATNKLLADNLIYGSEPSVVIFDFNQDGVDDFFIGGGTDSELRVDSFYYESNSTGGFNRVTIPTDRWIHGIDSYDVDGDGIPEIFTAGYDSSHLFLKYNEGTFLVSDYKNYFGFDLWGGSDIAVADFGLGVPQAVRTDDGQFKESTKIYDLTLLDSGEIEFRFNKILPPPRFELEKWDFMNIDPNDGLRSHDVKIYKMDITNNGLEDLIVASWPWRLIDGNWDTYSELQILINHGGYFIDETEDRLNNFNTQLGSTHYIRFIDINNDGYVDMFLDGHAFDNDYSKRFLMNSGRGSFEEVDSSLIREWSESIDLLREPWTPESKSTAMTIVSGENSERYMIAIVFPESGAGPYFQLHNYRGYVYAAPLSSFYTDMVTYIPELDEPQPSRKRGLPLWLFLAE